METYENILKSMRIDKLLKRIRVTEYLQKQQLGKQSFAKMKRKHSYFYSSELKPMTNKSQKKAQERQQSDYNESGSDKSFGSEAGSDNL